MALTIVQQPGSLSLGTYVHEVGNPTVYGGADNNYREDGFKFKFNIYDKDGQLNSDFVYLSNNDEGCGFYSPNLILKSQFYSDFAPKSDLTFSPCKGSIINYRVDIETFYSGDTQDTIQCYKTFAINAYNNKFVGKDFKVYTGAQKALTKRDNITPLKLNMNQFATLRFLSGKLFNTISAISYLNKIFLRVVRTNGVIDDYWSYETNPYYTTTLLGDSSLNPVDASTYMIEVPAGPANLNQIYWIWDQTYINGSWVSKSQVFTPELGLVVGDKYCIRSYSWPQGDLGKTSQEYWYEITCNDSSRHTPIELGWRNEYGGYDYFNFTKVSEVSLGIERETYTKGIDTFQPTKKMAHNEYSRGETIINQNIDEHYVINTDTLSKKEVEQLDDLWYSPDVFAYINEVWYPIILEVDEVVTKTTKLGFKQYSIPFRLSNKKNKTRI